MIPNFNTFLKESTWNDIRKQSAGAKTRLEDDVNLMDGDEFFGYLLANYKYDGSENITCGSKMIKIPVFRDPHSRMPKSILFNHKNKMVFVRTPIFEKWPKDMKQLIFDNYNVEDDFTDVGDHIKFISPKEGECDNKFVLGLIDSMLKTAKYPYLEKRIAESVWNDIRKQSSGVEIRQEDDINILDGKELCKYLNTIYECSNKFQIRYVGKNVYVPVLKRADSEIIGNSLAYDVSDKMVWIFQNINEYVPDLVNLINKKYRVTSEQWGNYNKKLVISPIDGSTSTNQFYLDVIEFIRTNTKEENCTLFKK